MSWARQRALFTQPGTEAPHSRLDLAAGKLHRGGILVVSLAYHKPNSSDNSVKELYLQQMTQNLHLNFVWYFPFLVDP